MELDTTTLHLKNLLSSPKTRGKIDLRSAVDLQPHPYYVTVQKDNATVWKSGHIAAMTNHLEKLKNRGSKLYRNRSDDSSKTKNF